MDLHNIDWSLFNLNNTPIHLDHHHYHHLFQELLDNERDSIITNPNYESHIYEVVDPVYELSDNIESKL